jgi:CubicO group peptidase (beta-lactamase class C family)
MSRIGKLNRGKAASIATLAFLAACVLQTDGQHPAGLQAPPPAVQTPNASEATAPSNAAPAMTAADLDAFLDGIVPLQLKRENIAGAVVLVVKDGKVLYAKGYGYADVTNKKPVTVDATLFRPGSISKLFTWTAVMQLVEQGKIDLHRNINDYLDFKIPDTFPQPITMWNLMTHTPGFEESAQDLISSSFKDIEPLGEYLKTHMPKRVFPPGVTPAYSNYGATLAGYIVQRVSGMPFDEYMDKNIFQPLNMQHSTFRQPLPANLKPLMSDGYAVASGKPKPFEIVVSTPAGAMSTTAEDISHFMLAHLQGGEYNGARILQPATVQMMHSRQYAPNPAVHGMCLGFYEETRNGQRIIGHGGDTVYFHSDLHLIQDANVGFFVSYNSAGSQKISPREALVFQFLDRYFPYSIPIAHPPADAVKDAKSVAGQYMSSRGAFTTVISFFGVLGELTVSPKPDGTITVDDFKNLAGIPKTWEEISPMVYRAQGSQDLVAFSRNSDGRMRMSVDFPFMVFDRVSWINGKWFNMFLVCFVPIVCILTLILWPISAWMRRHYGTRLVLTSGQKWRRIAIRLVCLADTLFVAAWVILLSSSGGEPLFTSHMNPWLRLIQVIGWIGTIGTIVVIYSVISNWGAQRQWWLSHLGNTVIVCACVGFSWLLLHWHLLHFSLKY